jgi:TRAP-type mannitol/chloroaromatic compound transport system permease small subunit
MNAIETFIKKVGEYSSWFNLLLVLLICLDVVQRYLFNQTFNWILELEWHFFGLVFLLGSAYTFQHDKHVRVDVFYHKFSEKGKAIVDLLGSVFLLLPMCVLGVVTCYKYASNSFYIKENSPNPGGLPAWYIIKYLVVLCFVMLILQGVIYILKQIKTIRS